MQEILFGKYYKSNDKELEPIEWIKLPSAAELYISKYIIDAVPYHNTRNDVNWQNSYIRKWLNNDFLNIAFNEEEQNKLQLISGNKIGLLSAQKCKDECFVTDAERVGIATKYAIDKGIHHKCDAAPWWLRDNGYFENDALVVSTDGSLTYKKEDSLGFKHSSCDMSSTIVGVRPVISL